MLVHRRGGPLASFAIAGHASWGWGAVAGSSSTQDTVRTIGYGADCWLRSRPLATWRVRRLASSIVTRHDHSCTGGHSRSGWGTRGGKGGAAHRSMQADSVANAGGAERSGKEGLAAGVVADSAAEAGSAVCREAAGVVARWREGWRRPGALAGSPDASVVPRSTTRTSLWRWRRRRVWGAPSSTTAAAAAWRMS